MHQRNSSLNRVWIKEKLLYKIFYPWYIKILVVGENSEELLPLYEITYKFSINVGNRDKLGLTLAKVSTRWA